MSLVRKPTTSNADIEARILQLEMALVGARSIAKSERRWRRLSATLGRAALGLVFGLAVCAGYVAFLDARSADAARAAVMERQMVALLQDAHRGTSTGTYSSQNAVPCCILRAASVQEIEVNAAEPPALQIPEIAVLPSAPDITTGVPSVKPVAPIESPPPPTGVDDKEALLLELASLETRVAALDQRIGTLESERHVVAAPFVVTDDAGQIIMAVDGTGAARGLSIENGQSVPIITVGTTAQGGLISIRAASGGVAAELGMGQTGGFVAAAKPSGGQNFALLGAGDNTFGVVTVRNGQTAAELGVDKNGWSTVSVNSADGKPRAALLAQTDNGFAGVYNQQGQMVSYLGNAENGSTGGGRITTTSSDGKMVAQLGMGTNGGYVGVARPGDPANYSLIGATDQTFGMVSIRNGAPVAEIMAGEDQIARFIAWGGKDKVAAEMNSTADGFGGLNIENSQGNPIVTLGNAVGHPGGGEVQIRDPAGMPVGELAYGTSGGYAVVYTPDQQKSVTIAGTQKSLGVLVDDADQPIAQMGKLGDGRGFVYAYGAGGVPLAGLQSTDDGRGQISVFNKSGMPIAFLSESDKHPGGGNVTAADPGGSGVFSAGYDGLEGEACVDRKEALHCLGVDLPLTIGE